LQCDEEGGPGSSIHTAWEHAVHIHGYDFPSQPNQAPTYSGELRLRCTGTPTGPATGSARPPCPSARRGRPEPDDCCQGQAGLSRTTATRKRDPRARCDRSTRFPSLSYAGNSWIVRRAGKAAATRSLSPSRSPRRGRRAKRVASVAWRWLLRRPPARPGWGPRAAVVAFGKRGGLCFACSLSPDQILWAKKRCRSLRLRRKTISRCDACRVLLDM
jgi:hypothetical protein